MRERRFAAILNRFDWATVAAEQPGMKLRPRRYSRRRCALRFERVRGAKLLGIDLADRSRVLSLLTVQFEPTTAPAGFIVLVFADGAAVRLEVECIETELRDLGGAWRTKAKPDHSGSDDGKAG